MAATSESTKRDAAVELKASLEEAENPEAPVHEECKAAPIEDNVVKSPSRTPAQCGVPAVALNRLGAPKPWSTGLCGCCDQGCWWWCKNIYFCSCCNLGRAIAIVTKSNYCV